MKKIFISHRVVLGVCLIAHFSLWGCQSVLFNMSDRQIPDSRRIPLNTDIPDTHPVIWHGTHLDVEYSAQKKDNYLNIKGQIHLNGLAHFSTIETFKLEIFLIDSRGYALGRYPLFIAGRYVPIEFTDLHFNREFPLSENVRYMAFGYDGRVLEGGGGFGIDGDGIAYSFIQSPYWP